MIGALADVHYHSKEVVAVVQAAAVVRGIAQLQLEGEHHPVVQLPHPAATLPELRVGSTQELDEQRGGMLSVMRRLRGAPVLLLDVLEALEVQAEHARQGLDLHCSLGVLQSLACVAEESVLPIELLHLAAGTDTSAHGLTMPEACMVKYGLGHSEMPLACIAVETLSLCLCPLSCFMYKWRQSLQRSSPILTISREVPCRN